MATVTKLSLAANPEGQYKRITQRTRTIYEHMKKAHPFLTGSKDSAFAALLAMSELDDIHIAEDMMAVDDFLEGQRGFAMFGIGVKQRRMYAGILTMCDYMPDAQTIQAAALSGVVTLVVAQQAALCASMAAVGAASASNASN